MKVRRSMIWSLTKAELEKLLAENDTFSDILRSLGLRVKGSFKYDCLKKRLF